VSSLAARCSGVSDGSSTSRSRRRCRHFNGS
jgi:hypothetical protein